MQSFAKLLCAAALLVPAHAFAGWTEIQSSIVSHNTADAWTAWSTGGPNYKEDGGALSLSWTASGANAINLGNATYAHVQFELSQATITHGSGEILTHDCAPFGSEVDATVTVYHSGGTHVFTRSLALVSGTRIFRAWFDSSHVTNSGAITPANITAVVATIGLTDASMYGEVQALSDTPGVDDARAQCFLGGNTKRKMYLTWP